MVAATRYCPTFVVATTIMKSLITLIPAFALAVFCTAIPALASGDQAVQSAPSSQGLTIVAEAAQQTYTVGDDVKVDVIVRNGGTSDANIGGSAFDLSSFRFVVLDPSSHPLTPTPFARKLLGVPTKVKKNLPIKIGAGWQRRYEFELSKMFALSEPGMYSIAVKRVVVLSGQSDSSHRATSQVVLLASDPIAVTLTGSAAVNTRPAETPPSTQAKPASRWTIAFVRSGDIWMANGEGNEQRLVIRNGEAPSWSPDKTVLAFARKGDVWISDPNGQNQKQLTDSASLEAGVNPVFSPDGKWIAYRSWSQQAGIMVREVSIDGKTDKELLQDGEDPAW